MKRLMLGLGVIMLIVVALAVGFALTFDVNRYKSDITAYLSERTGRAITIEGEIRFVPAWVPTIAVEGVRIANARWGSGGDLLQIRRVEARVALKALLEQRLEVQRLVLDGVVANLQRNAEGETNWQLQGRTRASSGMASAPVAALTIDAIEIADVRAQYREAARALDLAAAHLRFDTDRAGALALESVLIENLTLQYRAGPRIVDATLATVSIRPDADANALAAAGLVGKTAIRIDGTTGSWAAYRSGQAVPFDLKADYGGVQVEARGHTAAPAAGKGLNVALKVLAPSATALGALIGVALPPLAPASLDATIRPHDAHYAFEALQLRLGRSDLAGSGVIAPGTPRTRIEGEFTSEQLDLSEWNTPGAPARSTPDPQHVFPRTALDLSALTKLDFDGSLRAGLVRTRAHAFGKLQARIALQNGVLKLMPVTAAYAGGTFELALAANGAAPVPAIDVRLRAKGIIPNQLPQFAGKNLIQDGRTDVEFAIAGTGRSIAEVMGNGNGRLLVRVGPGLLPNSKAGAVGADLVLSTVNALNPLATRESATRLECAVINFGIKAGIASGPTGLGLRTDKLNVLGGGTVDLKTERIDIGAKPKPRQGIGLNLASLSDFVRLGGTLANPQPVTDAKGVATGGLKVGAAVATGGLSLLAEGLFDRASSDDDVCAIAGGAARTPSAPTTTAAAPAKKTSVVEKAADTTKGAVEGAGKAVKSVFKGLFGN